MNEQACAAGYSTTATYQVENRQFIVNRMFGTEKTVAEILAEEITDGLLQPSELSSQGDYDILRA